MGHCYADAYFVGMWGHGNPQDHICNGSRNGFVVNFYNCPILWVSKTCADISLYTLCSEYVALSRSVRALLPFKSLIKKVIDNLIIDSEKLKFVSRSTLYEDNNGAIVVATSTRMTPTSKQIYVKYHWFRKHVEKEFVIQKFESENQKADIFTKGFKGEMFWD